MSKEFQSSCTHMDLMSFKGKNCTRSSSLFMLWYWLNITYNVLRKKPVLSYQFVSNFSHGLTSLWFSALFCMSIYYIFTSPLFGSLKHVCAVRKHLKKTLVKCLLTYVYWTRHFIINNYFLKTFTNIFEFEYHSFYLGIVSHKR